MIAGEIVGPAGDPVVWRYRPCQAIQVQIALRFMIFLDEALLYIS
jgi:hypothetical protein